MSSEIEELKNKLVLKPLNGPEELRDWMYTFLDIKFPMGVVYPGSTHGPVDAMWRIYELMKTGESRDVPQVCMLASRDSYKCQVKGSKVLTKDGLINIEKIQIGDVVWSGKNWRKVTNWIDDGEKKGIKVTLKNNIELTSTPIHRYWIIRNGKEQWCKAEDLEETDRICYNLNTPLSNGFEIEQEKFDNGYFLGLLMGDGGVSSIESPTHSHISFTTIDKTIKNWYYNYCINKFGKAPTQSKHDPITHCIWDKNAISEIIEMGVKPSRAWEKTIPNYCYTSNSAMMGFVSGLFDSDGTFDGKNAIDFPITAGKLLKELQIVFASWGINAKYRANSKKYSNQNHLVHHLIINGHEIPKLYKLGFVNKAKKAGYYKEPEIYDAHDTINFENIQFFIDYCNKNKPQIRGRKYLKPKIGYQRCKDSKVYEGITYGKINDLFLWFQENMEHNKAGNDAENIYKRVSNILNNRWYSFKKENVDSAHFYDLTVEKDHSYWCNGCISHNTLSAAAIEVLCMLHFEISVAHGAAIKSQSEKAIQYVNSFFRKLSPYLEANGWSKLSDSKAKIEWLTSKGDAIYLRIVVATVAGMNCISPYAIVETDKGLLLAKDINENLKIKTYDYIKNKQVFNPIKNIGYTIKEARKIVLDNGSELVLSDDHQVFTQRGWITADQLKVGYKLHAEENTKATNMPQPILSVDLDKRLDQMILGQLLGDASLNFLPSGSVRFQVTHTEEQKQYLQDTKNIFEINGIKCNICKDGEKQYKLTTQTHEIFKNISKITHLNGKKQITKKWLDLIEEEGLSYLVMDDGTINSKKVGVHKTQGIKIATFSFSKEENEKIVKKFKELGFEASLWNKGKYVGVKLSKNSSRELSTVIRPYFSNCLKYKLLPPLEHVQFVREIDTGNAVLKNAPSYSFTWSNPKISNLKYGRDIRKQIKSNLNAKIKSIEIVGKQELIDIEVDTQNEHQKSFFANGILVHNSEHVPMLFMDEIDVVQDPRALEEAKMIPCVYKGYFPLTVYLSTRKYAGGLMEKTLKDTERSGGEILRWNIIDVTERIPHSEAKINEEKVMRYISRELPLRNLSPDEFEELNEESRHKYEAISVYPGIADHPMLSVMKNSLADRPQDNVGDLYKPIYAVHNNFKQTSPEMGEAQLLCNKPSSSGLVYPRFDSSENAISIDEAYTYLSGEEEKNKTLDDLIQYMHNLGIEFYGAADWGNTDETALGIFAKITGGKSWLIDLVSAPDMEIPEIVIKVKELTEIYKVKKWFCDSNYPAYIKMLRKTNTENGKIPAVGVKKGAESVVDGITCVQSKIVDANNNRDFKVLKTRNTERVFDAFETYKWKIDGKGNPIDGKPEHGKDGTADIMDMVRYFFYSMFGRGSKVLFSYDLENTKKRPANLQHKINELSGNRDSKIKKTGKNKGIILDI